MTDKINPSFDLPLLQSKTLVPLQWCIALIGLSVPVSVALDNVLLGVILLGALFSLGSTARIAMRHPVARAALMLFTLLALAMFYGATPIGDAVSALGKYVDLVFVPIFIVLLSGESSRHRARYAFILAMAVTLILSYLVGLKMLSPMSWMNTFVEPGNPVVFHSHITQNNMMAFAVFLALLEWREATVISRRIAWAVFAMLGSVNVLFMVQGRTGYLILLTLLGWFMWSSLAHAMRRRGKEWGWKQAVFIMLAVAVTGYLAYHTSARLHERVGQVMSEYEAWTPDHGKLTSTGQRLDFYSNTLQIVRDHALTGVGTGGFPAAYAQQTAGKDVMETKNAHNEYLMIAVQTGVAGLALLLYLFYVQWHHAPRLPTWLEQDAARGLVLAYVVNCMLNSALRDHADGLFFAFMAAVLFAGLDRGDRRA